MAIFILNKISLLEPKAQNCVRSALKRSSRQTFARILMGTDHDARRIERWQQSGAAGCDA
jgi:hypothetical protein